VLKPIAEAHLSRAIARMLILSPKTVEDRRGCPGRGGPVTRSSIWAHRRDRRQGCSRFPVWLGQWCSGDADWRTSLFPDKARGSLLLPVKKPVRAIEGLSDGTACQVALSIVD